MLSIKVSSPVRITVKCIVDSNFRFCSCFLPRRQLHRLSASPSEALNVSTKVIYTSDLRIPNSRQLFSVAHNTPSLYLSSPPAQFVSGRLFIRWKSSTSEARKYKSRTTVNYLVSIGILLLGMSYLAVPLYRVFCQVTGIGGASNLAKHGDEKVENLVKVEDRQLRILFTADTASHLHWHFKPVQREVYVYPGETALAFYTARNPTDRPIIGISTYTVLPFEAAKYLNKIQCFCFEEQRLNPHEQVDMPVFFYIDPEFVNDPWLQKTSTVTLSYTFFEAKDGFKFVPQQGITTSHNRILPLTSSPLQPAVAPA